MALKLENVVPFGRSFDEYRRMFDLTDGDLDKRIISVGDGPAAFNAGMKALGKRVISVDPLYVFSADVIEKRFYEVVEGIIEQVIATPDDWTWSYHKSPGQLKKNRTAALEIFVADYEQGKKVGRYVPGELPRLDFKDGEFDIALCSHLLFLYSERLDYEFHRASAYEMLRIAEEVRIFPLLDLSGAPSPHVEPLTEQLRADGYEVEIRKVSYEIQRGGNEMMWVGRGICICC